MAGNRGGKKKTAKKSGKSTTTHVAEEHVEELSDGNNSDDLCEPPSKGMKGLKRKCPSTGGGVFSRTRARKAVSNGNEPVREESNPVRGTTVVSLSLDTETEGMSAVSSKSDVATRKFTKTEDKEKVTIVEGSSSNSCLESVLKGVENRIVKAMEEGFSGINLTVETKLEAMNWTMDKLEKNQRVLKKNAKKIEDRLTSIESKGNEDEKYRQWNDFDYGRDHGKDREMAEAEKDKEKAETRKKNSEKGEKDEENSGKDEEDVENSKKSKKDEENNEKGEEEEEQEHEKDKENNSLLRLHERVSVQAEEFWRTIDDESDDEKEAEKEVEKEAEEEGEKDGEKEVREEKEAEKDGEKEAEKEEKEEKEAEKEESKGTPTSTGLVIITPHGRTKVAAARKVNTTPPEIVVVIEEKTSEQEAMVTEQEAIQTEITEQEVIQTEIVEKEAEITEKDAEVAEKEDQDVLALPLLHPSHSFFLSFSASTISLSFP
ncbi:hypothetical protein IGI04_030758 [Brassica rapa subsp. trilocularis]|uniref:Uncharacterized protein n=1 Tax=Brassica rapa subsp. trilocularis TaxID=1813537 RepID=A0ABQ7LSJ2_BRACM|nr:hypothetical protein IGI04_030758 [Brassica rapa subsp. trilocularis]